MMWWLLLACLYAASVCVAVGALTVIDFRDNEPTTSWREHSARGVALVFVALAWPVVLLLGWSKRKAAPLPSPQPVAPGDFFRDYPSAKDVPVPGEERRGAQDYCMPDVAERNRERWEDYVLLVEERNRRGFPRPKHDPHQHGEGI